MKTITVLFLVILTLAKIHAQDYLISFAGAGDTTWVSTVKVDNLTSGATVTLNGGDILHLIGSSTGIPDIDNVSVQIYPNPMAEHSTLTFVAPESGDAVIGIFDLSGKTVYQIRTTLSPGAHSFSITGLTQGMYFIKVFGKNFNHTIKLISQSNLQTEAKIAHVSSVENSTSNRLKGTAINIDMTFNEGDQLLYKGISGIYSTIVPDVPFNSKTITFNFLECTDNDNNNYTVVNIGSQTWMAVNLKTTKYKDGTSIPLVTDNTEWENTSTPGYCWYNNTYLYKDTYGALYNWFTVNTGKLAPTGWHIPTDAEWTVLTTFLGGEDVAGGKLKEVGTSHWTAMNAGVTNASGFSGLPGGYRMWQGGFYDLADRAVFWSSSEADNGDAWLRELHFSYETVNRFDWYQLHGYSVRCLKNDSNTPVTPTVTTTTATNITQTTATSGGKVTSQGSSTVTERGICWDTSSNPTTVNSHVVDSSCGGDGTGGGCISDVFVANMTGLIANTSYYVRAYARNSAGTVYGNEINFNTLATVEPVDSGSIYVVHGSVMNADLTPAAGLTVIAYNQDPSEKRRLGKAVTDAEGQYMIHYSPIKFLRAEKTSIDLYVIVVDAADRELVSSEVLFNAPSEAIINLTIPSDGTTLSEFEILLEAILPVLTGMGKIGTDLKITELEESDIVYLSKESGQPRERISFLLAAVNAAIATLDSGRLSLATPVIPAGTIPVEAFYGWFRQELPQDFSLLMQLSVDELMASLAQAVSQAYIPAFSPEQLKVIEESLQQRRI